MARYFRIAFILAALFAFVMAILPHPPLLPGHPSDKIQHVIAFAALGILSAFGFTDRSAVVLFALLTIYGATIELVQAIPALHRDSDVFDLIADMVATGIALALSRRIIAWRREKSAPRA